MNRRSTRGILVALAFGLSSLVWATPAAAETVLLNCSGTCGSWSVRDQGPSGPAGAICGYETASMELDYMSIRPPRLNGHYASSTRVEWRFKIRRAANFYSGSHSTIFTSSWQRAMASTGTAAYLGHGFTRRMWSASENPSGYYYVRLEFRWWHNGSVEGTARIQYDWYKLHNSGFGDYVSPDPYCYEVA